MYDVAVIGGGIAGSMAALGAARYGAKVILIEQYGFLGGTLTACGTGPMMTFHSGDVQVIQGITGELIERLKARKYSPGHIFDTTGYTYTVTPFSAEGMKAELEYMMEETGVDLLYHSVVCDVDFRDTKLNSIEVYGKNGKRKIKAKIFVDASGDCDITYLCGLPYTKGREADGKSQPLTMNFKVINVDIEKVKRYINENNDEFPRLKGDLGKVYRSERLSIGGFVKTLKNARAAGTISFDREDILFFETDTEGEVIVNTTRVINVDPTDPEQLTFAEIEGRRQAREVFELLKSKVSGFENANLEFTGPFIGVRSSRQIKGKYTLSANDILSCREFEDTIAKGGYPIDVHSPDGKDDKMYEEGSNALKYGDIYNIPYSSLISTDASNLITVGRCISATFEAQAAIRVSPNAGAIGHGGGVAAGICALKNIDVNTIDTDMLREELIKQGAYL